MKSDKMASSEEATLRLTARNRLSADVVKRMLDGENKSRVWRIHRQ
jgi:hypothetical protein